MPLVDIPFAKSSMPGQRPGEGLGRNINALCEMDGGSMMIRPVAGLAVAADTGQSVPRGFLDVGGVLYAAYEDTVVTVAPTGTVTELTGLLQGTDLVFWARNNKAPTPDILLVSEQGIFTVAGGALTPFVDGDLPAPTDVTVLDGFFLVTIGDGRVFASELNDTEFNALSFATCQSSPDGLLRGTVSGQLWYGWGSATTEVWQNVGSTPFPLSRVSVIPVGLMSRNAVAGYESGWDRGQIFVAADATVRRLEGYSPVVVSTKDVERAIQTADKATLEAFVYMAGGHPIWSLSSDRWTWELNVATGFWHERRSLFDTRWRARASCRWGSDWIVGDRGSGQVLRVTEDAFTEAGQVIPMIVESGPTKEFPSRLQVSAAYFDWTVGQGQVRNFGDAAHPTVLVSWSDDGGGSWSKPLERSLGGEGQFAQQVRVNVLGKTSHHGRRWRLLSSSPVYRTLRGGRMQAEARRP